MKLLPRIPSLFRVLRHRTPSSPIYPSEVIRKPFALQRVSSIQRREKCPSREEKSAFTQWFSRIYARSLKDQAHKSKYPRTQILEPRTQSKLICHSSATFIPMRSNNPIQVTSQSYIGISPKLYSFLLHPIQLYPRTHIPIYEPVVVTKCTYTDSFSILLWLSAFRARQDNRSKVLTAGTRYCFTPNNLE